MSEFHRMITYLYLYESGKKEHNVGFAKIEKQDIHCRIEIHMKNTGYSISPIPVYFYTQKQQQFEGILLGNMSLSHGNGDFKLISKAKDLADSGYSLDVVTGIFIPLSEKIMFVSQWNDNEFIRENFIISKKSSPVEQTTQQQNMPEQTVLSSNQSSSTEQTAQQQEQQNIPEQTVLSSNQSPSTEQTTQQDMPEQTVLSSNQSSSTEQTAQQQEQQNIPEQTVLSSNQSPSTEQTTQQNMPEQTILSSNQSSSTEQTTQQQDMPEQIPSSVEQVAEEQKNIQEQAVLSTEQSTEEQVVEQQNIQGQAASSTKQTSNQAMQRNTRTSMNQNMQRNTRAFMNQNMQRNTRTSMNQNMQRNTKPSSISMNSQNQHIQASSQAAKTNSMAANLKAAEAIPKNCQNVNRRNAAQSRFFNEQQKHLPENWELKWKFILENYPVMTPFAGDENTICVRFELKDIRMLPRQYWYLGNNSFLLHGFFNYRYLILGMTEENEKKRWFLGIPGIFQNPERVMASLFGFPEFRNEKSASVNTGEFGYWFRYLEE